MPLAIVLSASMLASTIAAVPPEKPTMPPRGFPPNKNPLTPPGEQSGSALVDVRMVADVTLIKPGEKFHLVFFFDVEPGWHIYWENSGASGAPTEIRVRGPEQFAVGRTLFTRPQIIDTPEGPCYGYEGQAALFVEVTPPPTALGQVRFNAEVSWLVCKEVCKQGSATASLTLPFGRPGLTSPEPAKVDPGVEPARARLPLPLESLKEAKIEMDGKTLAIDMPASGATTAEFFPNPSPGVVCKEPTVEKHGDVLRISVPVEVNPNDSLGRPLVLSGVIGRGAARDEPSYSFSIPLGADGRPQRN